ncbi:MAG: bifunctional homocysteine S-methyltransferase/methylenetetrahydrofolate reductase [Armatimonadota bacterium]|nr:bifunctional homocysteine S-methyltransferase/methylenetetrahydrofolate reductase [bacterium]
MPDARKLPDIFSRQVVVFDGAMGSLLVERGISHLHPFEELNFSRPEMVTQAHSDYIKAGANAIETNTFGANRFNLARHGLEDKTYEINLAGARLARSVAGSNIIVAGSIGQPGVSLAPIGSARIEDLQSSIEEQARALTDGGVDLILFETLTDLNQACVMLDTALDNCSLPIMVQFAIGADFATACGDSLEDVVARISDYPISALGVNCRVGPEQTLLIVQTLREICELPISAQPNSGFPTNIDGRTLFLSGAGYFADRGAEMVQAGASIVGGCCGTSPAHIEALAAKVKGLARPAPVKVRTARRKESVSVTDTCRRSPLLRKMNGEFVTVEVTPPKNADYKTLLDKLRPLVAAGITAIDVTDNPMARMHMSAVAFAHLVREELGVATILHLTCRDLNLLGMHSTLLGASALGIDGILALTGDPASVGDYPGATSVFDVTSDGLAKIVSSLNCGLDYSGRDIGGPTNFAIGTAFNPAADDLDREIERLAKKRESGANFLMTQPVFDLDPLRKAVERIPKEWDLPILIGVLPLRSSRHAEFLHHEVPGINIPDDIRETLAKADPEAAKIEGVKIAQEIYLAVKNEFGGVYFMPPFDNFDVVRQVIAGE